MLPSQPVARLMRIQTRNETAVRGNGDCVPGRFYPYTDNAVANARTLKVGCIVFRGKTFAVGKDGMLLEQLDRVCTGPGTFALIEFLIGGRVGLNTSTEVLIDSDRGVQPLNASPSSMFARNPRRLQYPLEIQTNGGVFGIKG